jgi:hypothetical protein
MRRFLWPLPWLIAGFVLAEVLRQLLAAAGLR